MHRGLGSKYRKESLVRTPFVLRCSYCAFLVALDASSVAEPGQPTDADLCPGTGQLTALRRVRRHVARRCTWTRWGNPTGNKVGKVCEINSPAFFFLVAHKGPPGKGTKKSNKPRGSLPPVNRTRATLARCTPPYYSSLLFLQDHEKRACQGPLFFSRFPPYSRMPSRFTS